MESQPDNVAQDNLVKKITKNRSTHLIIIGVVLIIVVIVLTVFGFVKGPATPITTILKKKPTVQLKTEYKNPFGKEAQYVNPFEKYKNPFVVSR